MKQLKKLEINLVKLINIFLKNREIKLNQIFLWQHKYLKDFQMNLSKILIIDILIYKDELIFEAEMLFEKTIIFKLITLLIIYAEILGSNFKDINLF